MSDISPHNQKIVLAFALGAIGGGVAALMATRAIPKMMDQMRTGMMSAMMGKMKESGCTPSEM